VSTTRITLTTGDTVDVLGELERVATELRSGWAQLNRAGEGEKPDWLWINGANVLHVEAKPEQSPA
jgi:hypothetical protein